MPLSVTPIWDETIAFVRRELSLLLPLSFATLAIGDAGVTLVSDRINAAGQAGVSGLVWTGFILAILLTLTGQLAISALTLSGGMSVAEAIKKGVDRLPKLLLVSLVVGLIATAFIIPLLVGLETNGFTIETPAEQWPWWAQLYLLLFIGVLAWFGTRMLTVSAVIVDQNPKLGGTIRTAFRMTEGHFLRLFALLVLYMAVFLIATNAGSSVIGIIFGLVGKTLSIPYLGKLMAALGGGMVSAIIGMVSTVFTTKLYQRLSVRT
jgi:hypothetical protein